MSTTSIVTTGTSLYFLIKSGKKTIEGRKNLPKYKHYKIGDLLVFCLGNDEFTTRIVAIRHYRSLEEYLLKETVSRVLPGVNSLTEGVEIYLQWSTREEIQRLGFLAIEVSLISDETPI